MVLFLIVQTLKMFIIQEQKNSGKKSKLEMKMIHYQMPKFISIQRLKEIQLNQQTHQQLLKTFQLAI